ncbi:winged helix-turn-helix transcriptional regulator [Thermococcus sp. M36]|uniref:helix-turn-helix transcriptional regulator n=1 Tax=Thermococcus sp. M36 TaxID=1638261 RepID=UPI001439024A|nr:helix-turn-helix domain-containing protein [Thermococcus sp. M36]NJE06140.1 winged helix-turn-helix transcriptional regulator [Thermococcus sp. M36]
MRDKLVSFISLLALMIILFHPVSAYTVSSLTLTVYGDGYVGVTYEVLPEEYEAQIQLPLLAEHVENVVVEDADGNPLNFRVDGDILAVYTGSADVIRVSYYTPDLTSKEGIVWTLKLSTNESFTVILPDNAVVVDLSDIPLEIAGNSITMPPGDQSISYTIEGRGPPWKSDGGSSGGLYYLVAGIVLAGGATYLLLKRRSSVFGGRTPTREEFEEKLSNLDLNEDERRALLYIFDKGGKASQAEVREAVGLPKTTAWRMFKRLERMGLVKILRGKKENWVELRF